MDLSQPLELPAVWVPFVGAVLVPHLSALFTKVTTDPGPRAQEWERHLRRAAAALLSAILAGIYVVLDAPSTTVGGFLLAWATAYFGQRGVFRWLKEQDGRVLRNPSMVAFPKHGLDPARIAKAAEAARNMFGHLRAAG